MPTTTARRTEGGKAGNGFQSISSGRVDLKTDSPGWCGRATPFGASSLVSFPCRTVACSKITSPIIAPLGNLDFNAISSSLALFRLGSNSGSETIVQWYRPYLRIDLLMKVVGAQAIG